MALFSAFYTQKKNANHTSMIASKRMSSASASRPHHGYHLVDPSPWPALTRLCLLWLTTSLVLYFHQFAGAPTVLIAALSGLVYTASLWWRDVNREGILGFHTRKVKNGLHLGMLLFIWSEAMFFVGLLWAFLHAALMPTIQLGMTWPPLGIVPVQWTGLPKTNTLLLLASYFTANAAKHRMDNGNKNLCKIQLITTIVLGLLFVYCQYLEYTGAPFTFSDSIFGSTFYLTTGFHGFHVIVGFLYLAVCLATLNSASPNKCTAMDLAILYWHFVDIVWVFLLILVYVWGGSVPSTEISACADGSCALQVILHDARAFACAHDASLFERLAASI